MLVQTSVYAQSTNTNGTWEQLTKKLERADAYSSLGEIMQNNNLTMYKVNEITQQAMEHGLVDQGTLKEARRILSLAEENGEVLDFKNLTKSDIAERMTKHRVAGVSSGILAGGIIAFLLVVLPVMNMQNKKAERAAAPFRNAELRAAEAEARAAEAEARIKEFEALQLQEQRGSNGNQ